MSQRQRHEVCFAVFADLLRARLGKERGRVFVIFRNFYHSVHKTFHMESQKKKKKIFEFVNLFTFISQKVRSIFVILYNQNLKTF